jgi:hypothetical protein
MCFCVRGIDFASFYNFNYGTVLTVWYFRIVPTVWYFRTVQTVWYFRIVLTVWYFRIVLKNTCPLTFLDLSRSIDWLNLVLWVPK